MKKICMTLVFSVCFFIMVGCSEESIPATDTQPKPTGLTLEERKDVFASYFNHNIPCKTGKLVSDTDSIVFEMECTDGSKWQYTVCKEGALGFYHPMTGSLDYSLPLEEGEEIIVFYIVGEDGVNYAKTVAPVNVSDKYTRIFTDGEKETSPQLYYKNMQSVIRKNLDSISNLQVLTLDEALSVFWAESGLDKKDFLQKTGSHGDVFYQHKTENHTIMATVNLLCTQAQDGEGAINADNPQEYKFTIIQNTGENYFIYLDGTVEKTEKIHGIYK